MSDSYVALEANEAPLTPVNASGREQQNVRGTKDVMKKKHRISVLAASLIMAFFFIFTPADYTGHGKINFWYQHETNCEVPHACFINLEATANTPLNVTVRYATSVHRHKADFDTIVLTKVNESENYYGGPLHKLGKGKKMFLWIELRDQEGNVAFIPSHAPDKPYLVVSYLGKIPPFLMSCHISFAMAGCIVMFHVLILALFIVIGGTSEVMPRMVRQLVLAWGLFFVSFIPLGMSVAQEADGHPWGGWPFGYDITDTKSEITLIILGVITALRVKILWKPDEKGETPWISAKTMAWLTLFAFVCTTTAMAIPHDLTPQ